MGFVDNQHVRDAKCRESRAKQTAARSAGPRTLNLYDDDGNFVRQLEDDK